MQLVEKSVLLKVSQTPSLRLARGASFADVVVELDEPHAARSAATTASAPSARRRLANCDFMVFPPGCRIPIADAAGYPSVTSVAGKSRNRGLRNALLL